MMMRSRNWLNLANLNVIKIFSKKSHLLRLNVKKRRINSTVHLYRNVLKTPKHCKNNGIKITALRLTELSLVVKIWLSNSKNQCQRNVRARKSLSETKSQRHVIRRKMISNLNWEITSSFSQRKLSQMLPKLAQPRWLTSSNNTWKNTSKICNHSLIKWIRKSNPIENRFKALWKNSVSLRRTQSSRTLLRRTRKRNRNWPKNSIMRWIMSLRISKRHLSFNTVTL
jgi:hypothetical protein